MWRIGLVVPVLMGACSGETPPGTAASELRATLVAGPNPFTVGATFTTIADDRNYALEAGDSLDYTFRGRTKPLPHTPTLLDSYGSVDFDISPAAGEVLTITLHRGGDDLVSTVAWPTPVVVEPPPQVVSRAVDVTFTWAAAANPEGVDYAIGGDCVSSLTGNVSDSGTLTIAANTLALVPGAPTTCTTELSLYRRVTGETASAFGDGEFTAFDYTTATFTTTP